MRLIFFHLLWTIENLKDVEGTENDKQRKTYFPNNVILMHSGATNITNFGKPFYRWKTRDFTISSYIQTDARAKWVPFLAPSRQSSIIITMELIRFKVKQRKRKLLKILLECLLLLLPEKQKQKQISNTETFSNPMKTKFIQNNTCTHTH